MSSMPTATYAMKVCRFLRMFRASVVAQSGEQVSSLRAVAFPQMEQ